MPQRKLQVLAPAPHLSPAFRIPQAFYDIPGAAGLVLSTNLDRLARLAECQQAVIRLLRDPISNTMLEVNCSLNTPPMSHEDALLHHAFKLAINEVFSRNTERVSQALCVSQTEPPAEHERQHAANLYVASPNATWQEIGTARETYHATEWLLGYAASDADGRGPVSISQALIEVSAGLVAAPQPELTETYQRWGAQVLASLPKPDDCLA